MRRRDFIVLLGGAAVVRPLAAHPAASATVARAVGDTDIERLVTRELAPIVAADVPGGVAVAVRISGRTLFFNYGLADRAAKRPITSDSLFNLASLRKLFEGGFSFEGPGRDSGEAHIRGNSLRAGHGANEATPGS